MACARRGSRAAGLCGDDLARGASRPLTCTQVALGCCAPALTACTYNNLSSPFRFSQSFVPAILGWAGDFTGGQLDKVPPLLNPLEALVWAGGLAYLAQVLKIVFGPLHRYNNVEPFGKQAGMESLWARRAEAAHKNAMECFPFFAAGVLAAIITGLDEDMISRFATVCVHPTRATAAPGAALRWRVVWPAVCARCS